MHRVELKGNGNVLLWAGWLVQIIMFLMHRVELKVW